MFSLLDSTLLTSVVSKYSLDRVLTREFLHFDTRLARTRVASTKRVTGGASFKFSK